MPACANCGHTSSGMCTGCEIAHYCSDSCAAEHWVTHANDCIGGLFGNKWNGVVERHVTLLLDLLEKRVTERESTVALNTLKEQSREWAQNLEKRLQAPFFKSFVDIATLWDEQIQEYKIRKDETVRSRNNKALLLGNEPGTTGADIVSLLAGKRNEKAVRQAWQWLVQCLDEALLARVTDNALLFQVNRVKCVGGAAQVEQTLNGKRWIVPT